MTRYLPDVPADKFEITLYHLLTHTAGLGMYSGGDYDVSLRDETISRILAAPLQSKPGEAFSYSNPGYSLLAAIIERVSGEGYETFLRANLFEPSGMRMTGYRLPKWEGSQLARGYMDARDQGTPLDHQWADSGPYWNLFGNGGMLSTAGDLHKWAQALKGEEILSAAAKRKLFTPALKNYAYGWRVAETAHGKHISHGGDSENGFSANFNIYPERDAVVIVLTNRIPFGDFLFQRRIVNRITPALFGAPLQVEPPVRPGGDGR
jgi:CubicO group peptidase (beta-lactamase class C family)